jgi:hypothetical protein
MGNQSRQRKAEKRRRRHQASSPRAELSVRELLYAAAGASGEPSDAGGGRYRALLARLAVSPQVEAEVGLALTEAFRRALALNWYEAEIRRYAERRLGTGHAALVGRGRVVLPSVDALACAVELLRLLLSLPALPKLGGAPRPSPSGVDSRMLEKVRALLAKAESTTFPEEAEALSAKAQELMARHAIDTAMIGAGVPSREVPTGMRLPVDDPYASAKSVLLSEVAAANQCRAIWSKGFGFSTVMGFESDLMFVEILYTSLLVQATSAMVASGAQVDRSGRSRTRSFRQAFLLAYAMRIGDRLREAEAASRASAQEAYGEALLPVLAGRKAAVEAVSAATFPGAVNRSLTISNAAGWAAGMAAAELASLSSRSEVPAGTAG